MHIQAESEWDDPGVVAAWRRWRSRFADQTRGFTEALLQAAGVVPGMHVLDLASGAGDPALALAKAVGPRGCVTATDISDAMLAIVSDVAHQEKIDNIGCRRADAAALTFPDESFDLVTCRLGIMHVPNVTEALRESRRVLRPGARAVFLVWGGSPAEQGAFLHHRILARHVEMPVLLPNAPGPLRFAAYGSLSAALRGAGFRQVEETTHRCVLSCAGPASELWQSIREMAAPLRHLLAGVSPDVRERIHEEVETALQSYSHGERIELPATVHIATGLR
ncbi:class I SAM-dependent methyltransferase [Pendulispora rubella]|uniref:Class I SAM-dependent methyltransferase n=1 Tax=Pendulispora rubella TaxID=2741070 RepID=A0ABZ2L5B8_9BACT